ncbi:ferredoxin [Peptococcaceae bacterium CEB3]|nr:ferredoxin [Peptococcaceae bacterium CEB3]
MIAKVDKGTCIGCGACPSICPEVFQMEDDGLATAYVNPVPEAVEGTAQEAADGCPVEAITIEK